MEKKITQKPVIRDTVMSVFFPLSAGRNYCCVPSILRIHFVFSTKPSSRGMFYFQQLVLKGSYTFKEEYDGIRESRGGFS